MVQDGFSEPKRRRPRSVTPTYSEKELITLDKEEARVRALLLIVRTESATGPADALATMRKQQLKSRQAGCLNWAALDFQRAERDRPCYKAAYW